MSTAAPHFAILAADAFERPVHLRLPFRFGAATVTDAPQAFARVRIRLPDGREAEGAGAELMIPKWFDKSPSTSNARNIDDLRAAVDEAATAYASTATRTNAFGHTARHHAVLMDEGERVGRPRLVTAFGGALLDRAVLDALCIALDMPFVTALQANLAGLDATLAPDLAAFDIDGFLGRLTLPATIAARHTVGLLDSLAPGTGEVTTTDSLPSALGDIIARYGHRHFKIKLRGEPSADIARLTAVAAVLDPLPEYAVTLDGNEQFEDNAAVAGFLAMLQGHPALRRLAASTLYLEQPLPRDAALRTKVSAISSPPWLIDESDSTYAAWPAARTCGYTGVSSKSCKGLYKALVNAMRCAQWNMEENGTRYFLSGEDLTTQAGLALQQDVSLAGVLGIRHVERNGHHYVDGFAGQGAPISERTAFLTAHPDLYEAHHDNVRVAIRDGKLSLRSLGGIGFASGADVDFSAMQPLVSRVPTMCPLKAAR